MNCNRAGDYEQGVEKFQNTCQILMKDETKKRARRKQGCNLTQEFSLNFFTNTELADLMRKRIPPHTYSSVHVETHDVNYYDNATKTFQLLKSKVIILKNDFKRIRPLFHSTAIYVNLKSVRDYLLDINSPTSKNEGKRHLMKLANTHHLLICIPIDFSREARVELISKKIDQRSIKEVIKRKPSSEQKMLFTLSCTRMLVIYLHPYLLKILQKIKHIFHALSPPKKIQFCFSKN